MDEQRSFYKWIHTPADGLTLWATEGADGPPNHDAIGEGHIKGWAEVSRGETDKGKGEVAHITYDGDEALAHDVLEKVKSELGELHPEAEIVHDATGQRRVAEYMGDNIRPGTPQYQQAEQILAPLVQQGVGLREMWRAVAHLDLSLNETWEIAQNIQSGGGQQSFNVQAAGNWEPPNEWQYAPGPKWFPQREQGVPVTHLLLNPDLPEQLTGYCGKQFIKPEQIVDENPTCMRCQWMQKSRGASYYEPQYPWIADTDGHTYLGGPGENHDLLAERHKIPQWRRQHEGVVFKGEVVHSTPMPPQAVLQAVEGQWAKDHGKDHETRKERGQFAASNNLMPGLEVEVRSYDGFQFNGRRGEVVSIDDRKGTALVVLHGDLGGTEFRINSLRTVAPDAPPWTQIPTEDTSGQLDTMVRNAAMSRTKLLQMATRLPHDQSQVVHNFGNGWTVRQLQTQGDRHREGHLMSNCWKFEPHEIPVDNLTEFMRSPLQQLPAFGGQDWYSLRDEDNLPHTSFFQDRNGGMAQMLGTHNAAPKQPYVDMLRQYADANGLDFPGFIATSKAADLRFSWQPGDAHHGMIAFNGAEDTTGIGYIVLDKSHTIHGMFVKPEFQRQGIATAMLTELKKRGVPVRHPSSSERSEQGEAWYQSLPKHLASAIAKIGTHDNSSYVKLAMPADPDYVYHATPEAMVPQIMQEGLKPQVSPATRKVWPKAIPLVHASDDVDSLFDVYGDFLHRGGRLALLKIPKHHFTYFPVQEDEFGPHDASDGTGREGDTWYSEHPIPPEHIEDTGVRWPDNPHTSKVATPWIKADEPERRSEWSELSDEGDICPRCGAKMLSHDYCKECKHTIVTSKDERCETCDAELDGDGDCNKCGMSQYDPGGRRVSAKTADYGGGNNMPAATGVEDSWSNTDMHTHTFPEMKVAPMPAMDHPRQVGFDTSKTYWGYLDGEVAFAATLHGAMHKVCVDKLDDTTTRRLTNLLAAGAYPQGMQNNIAAGVLIGNRPRIMATNVDRNAVYDAVFQKANERARTGAVKECDWCVEPPCWLLEEPSTNEFSQPYTHRNYACGRHKDHLELQGSMSGNVVQPYHPGQLFQTKLADIFPA